MDVVENLLKFDSVNGTERVAAHKFLCEYSERNFKSIVEILSDIVSNINHSSSLRVQAAAFLKDQLTSDNTEGKQICTNRWLKVPYEVRNLIKNNLIKSLSIQFNHPSCAAQCIAFIAIAENNEISSNALDSVIKIILKKESSDLEKANGLEVINFYCHQMDSLSDNQVNDFLTAAIYGLQKHQNSHRVQLEAMKILINTVKHFANNFRDESERNVILEVVCESVQNHQNLQLTTLGFECLIEIVQYYYPVIGKYMVEAIIPLAVHAIRSNHDDIALQGIEFFSTIYDIELNENNGMSSKSLLYYESKDYAHKFFKHLMPILFDKLIEQNENFNDESYTASKAAGNCFQKLTKCCSDIILIKALPLINDNIQSANWRQREAAVLVLGILLTEIDSGIMFPIVEYNILTLNKLMKDHSAHVQDTTAWVLYKISILLPEIIFQPKFLDATIETITQGLDSDPNTALKLCMTISSLSKVSLNRIKNNHIQSICLSPYLEKIIDKLLGVSEQIVSTKLNLRVVAYEAINDIISNSTGDRHQIVKKTIKTIIQRLYDLINLQTSFTNYEIFNELLGLLCSTLQTLLYKITHDPIMRISDSIMYAIICFYHGSKIRPHSKTERYIKEPIMVMSAVVHLIKEDFVKYMNSLVPYFTTVLNSHNDVDACLATISLLSDICHGIKINLVPYCENIMSIIISFWENEPPNQKIRGATLLLFGDIAVAVGDSFLRFIPMVFDILQQTAKFKKNDYDSQGEFLKMRANTIETYSLIINAVKGDADKPQGNHINQLEVYVPNILEIINIVAEEKSHDDGILLHICGLIGDVYQNFNIKKLPKSNESIKKLLKLGLLSKNGHINSLAKWSMELLIQTTST